MHEKINRFYRGLLESLGFDVTEDGFIKINLPPHTVPITVKDYPLVLPTDEHLRNPSKKTIFHPLREDIVGGESEVLQEIRKAVSLRINLLVTNIGTDLLNAAASTDLQKRIKADQSNLITSLGEVDADVVKKFVQVSLAAARKDPSKSYVGMYGKRAPFIDGKSYKRGCIVFFPIYSDLVDGADKIFGAKITAKQREALIRLHEFLFQGISHQDQYSRGSNSKIAPFFESFVHSAMGLLEALGSVASLFRNLTDTQIDLKDTDWYSDLSNLDAMTKDILMIPGAGGLTPQVSQDEQQSQLSTNALAPVPVPSLPMANTVLPPVNAVPAPVQQGISSLGQLINRNPAMAQSMYNAQMGMMSPMMNQGRPPPSWLNPNSPMSPAVGVVQQPGMGYQNPGRGYQVIPMQQGTTVAQLNNMIFGNAGPPF